MNPTDHLFDNITVAHFPNYVGMDLNFVSEGLRRTLHTPCSPPLQKQLRGFRS